MNDKSIISKAANDPYCRTNFADKDQSDAMKSYEWKNYETFLNHYIDASPHAIIFDNLKDVVSKITLGIYDDNFDVMNMKTNWNFKKIKK